MSRDNLVSKVILKISFNKLNIILEEIDRLLKHKGYNNLEIPKFFLKYFGNIVKSENLQKEEIQEILSKAKSLGIIKKYMERAWRAILKNYRLQGFLLEN